MRKTLLSTFFLCIFIISGCSLENDNKVVKDNTEKAVSQPDEKQQWDISPEFETSTGDKLVGKKDNVGIVGAEFKAGEVNKWLWHFWGDEQTIQGGNFKVVAINKDTGEKEMALVTDAGTANERKVWNYEELSYSPKGVRGSDSSKPSNMSLSKAGIWRLDVFIGAELFGTIVVDVK